MLRPKNSYEQLLGPASLPIFHLGPPLEKGPLPSVFYFALAGDESLALDPFNQPAILLAEEKIRVFSFTLPFHGPHFDKRHAMMSWAQQIGADCDIIDNFVKECLECINFLIEQDYVDASHMASAGLSRGGFIATHLAAQDLRIKTVLGYAPLTNLTALEEFKECENHPLVKKLSLIQLVDKLMHKKIRFYIGNRDTRVSTDECFAFIRAAAEYSYRQSHRPPPIELIVSASIGHKGHGTSPHIFKEGIEWLKKALFQKA